jgi:hypothetical protein
MKIKYKFLVFTVLVLHNAVLICAQSLYCELSINILKDKGYNNDSIYEASNKKIEYFSFAVFPVWITETVDLSHYTQDTLTLNLENVSPFNPIMNQIFFHDLSIYKVDKQKKFLPVDFTFDGKKLFIKNIKDVKKIELKYIYQSDFFIRNAIPNTLFYLQPQIYEWHSFYFVAKNMKLKTVEFLVPDEQAYFFATNTNEISNGKYSTVVDKIKNNDITFYLLKKNYYDKLNFTALPINVNLFMTKGVEIEDTIFNKNDTIKKHLIHPKRHINLGRNQVIHTTQMLLNKVVDIFNFDDSLCLNIIDASLTMKDYKDKEYTWGKTIESANKSSVIILDTSFWSSHSLIHEMIHVFNKYNDNKEYGYYFFEESIVEYLAVCLWYDDLQKRDSVFTSKLNYYNDLKKMGLHDISIFDINKNEFQLHDTFGGTSPIIYLKTPCIINEFAKSIGDNIFLSIIKKYYKNVKNKKMQKWSDFKKTFISNGISKTQLDNFEKEL